MMITHATLDALRVTFSEIFANAYENTKPWYERVATTVPSSGKSNVYGWKAMQTALRKWVGPRVVQNLSEHKYQIDNVPYEATVELSKFDIRDDNLGIFMAQTMPDLGQAVRKHPDQLIAALILANPTAFDGLPLFDDNHLCFDSAASTFDNKFTANLDGAGVQSVYAAMTSIKGENGQPLGIMPNLLIVPPQLQRNALVVAQSTTYALPGTIATVGSATVDNPMRGWFDVLVIPELASAPNDWYMADVSKSVKPFIYQPRDPFELVARDNLQDPKVFDLAKFTYGVDGRDNAGVGLPFLIARATHTP